MRDWQKTIGIHGIQFAEPLGRLPQASIGRRQQTLKEGYSFLFSHTEKPQLRFCKASVM
jgi:hypothetical protein